MALSHRLELRQGQGLAAGQHGGRHGGSGHGGMRQVQRGGECRGHEHCPAPRRAPPSFPARQVWSTAPVIVPALKQIAAVVAGAQPPLADGVRWKTPPALVTAVPFERTTGCPTKVVKTPQGVPVPRPSKLVP